MTTVAERFDLGKLDLTGENFADSKLNDILNKVSLDLIDNSVLSERQKEIFVSIADNMDSAENIVGVWPFNNISDNIVDNTMKGYVCALSPNAPAKVDYLANNFLECTAIAKIRNAKGGVTQENLANLGEKLDKAVNVFSETPCSLRFRNPITGLDKKSWKPELGEQGEAGIYKSSNDWEPEYYVIVRASIPNLSAELSDKIQAEEMTIEELYNNPMFSWAKEASKRNALQIMYNISSALGLRLGDPDRNKVQKDFTSTSTETQAHSLMSVADHIQCNNTIEEMTIQGNTVYGVFEGVVPYSHCKDQLLVYSGCKGGYQRFDTKSKTDAMIGYPATTVKNPEKINSITNKTPVYGKYFTWKGKEGLADNKNPQLHPETYAKVDDSFQDILGLLGMEASHPVETLRAVCVKISAHNQSRTNE